MTVAELELGNVMKSSHGFLRLLVEMCEQPNGLDLGLTWLNLETGEIVTYTYAKKDTFLSVVEIIRGDRVVKEQGAL